MLYIILDRTRSYACVLKVDYNDLIVTYICSENRLWYNFSLSCLDII